MSASPSPAPGQPHPTPDPEGGPDPSMEDILASIRRILSEDEADAAPAGHAPPPALAPASPATEPHGHDDVLDLDAAMIVEEPEAPAAEAAPAPQAPAPPVVVPPTAAEPVPPEPMAAPLLMGEPLVAPEAAAAAATSVGELLRSVVAGREQVAVYRGGPTIEDMVREEVRPLLKLWLDTHLPPLVERLVRAEMERIVGRVS